MGTTIDMNLENHSDTYLSYQSQSSGSGASWNRNTYPNLPADGGSVTGVLERGSNGARDRTKGALVYRANTGSKLTEYSFFAENTRSDKPCEVEIEQDGPDVAGIRFQFSYKKDQSNWSQWASLAPNVIQDVSAFKEPLCVKFRVVEG